MMMMAALSSMDRQSGDEDNGDYIADRPAIWSIDAAMIYLRAFGLVGDDDESLATREVTLTFMLAAVFVVRRSCLLTRTLCHCLMAFCSSTCSLLWLSVISTQYYLHVAPYCFSVVMLDFNITFKL